jgi:RNA polymerase sigma-70 factor (ECF subfamily)
MGDHRSAPESPSDWQLPSSASGWPDRGHTKELIRRARDGSDSALGALTELCRPYLMLVATKELDSELRPKGGASDLVQDTFVDVQRDFNNFRGQTEEEFFGWLTVILTNRVSNHVRRYRRTIKRSVNRELPMDLEAATLRSFDNQAMDTPSALVSASEEQRRVQLALARLPEDMQRVLVLRTWEHKGFNMVGMKMGRSADAARKLWGRAVERLEKELGKIS